MESIEARVDRLEKTLAALTAVSGNAALRPTEAPGRRPSVQRVLEAVSSRDGVSATELMTLTGHGRPTVDRALRDLVATGELVRNEMGPSTCLYTLAGRP